MKQYLLKEMDNRIISLLDGQSRLSINKIAGKLRCSKDGVNYKFKKLIETGVITRCFAEIDISKIGYMIGKVAMQFQNVDDKLATEIFNYLKDIQPIPWIAFCSGRWDCIFGFFVKDIYEMQTMLNDISERYGKFILSKEVLMEPEYYIVGRGYLNLKEHRIIAKVGGRIENNIDELDKKILYFLSNNCRTPILEIAIKTKQSSGTIINRIRNLEKKGVIRGYFIGLNLEKIDMEYCKAFVYLQNTTKDELQRLVNYCLTHPNVIAISSMVGRWEMEIEMEVKNFDEFYKNMNNIKTKFKNIIRSYEAVTITKEYGRDYNKFI